VKLAILGGTGGVGTRLVAMALDAGHSVTAYARDVSNRPTHPQLTFVKGELSDVEAISRTVSGADAVLSALGPRQNTPEQVAVFGSALENITRAMHAHGVKRLVSISGAALLLPSDHITMGRRIVRTLMLTFLKHAVAAKEREAEIIRASDLEWTLVRPPRIISGPVTGTYRVFADRPPSSKISQGDVAHLMLKCATDAQWIRQAPIPGI
jgi:putative NADH-flavin reductase